MDTATHDLIRQLKEEYHEAQAAKRALEAKYNGRDVPIPYPLQVEFAINAFDYDFIEAQPLVALAYQMKYHNILLARVMRRLERDW